MNAREIYGLQRSQRIQAIKAIREAGNLGLKEAKDVSDAALQLPEAKAIQLIAEAIGEVQQTKIVTKRGAEVRSWNGAMLAQMILDDGKLVISDGDGYKTLVFPADILDSIIDALDTLRDKYNGPMA